MNNTSKLLRSLKQNYGSKYFRHHLTKNKCHQTKLHKILSKHQDKLNDRNSYT